MKSEAERQRTGSADLLWWFAALAGLGVAISLLASGVWLIWPHLGRIYPPDEFASLWGPSLISAGLALLILCAHRLIWANRR